MAEQLWRTWSFAGLTGRPGMNIYARSPGLHTAAGDGGGVTLDWASTMRLPAGMGPATRPEDVPVGLALVISPDGQRLLTHRAYTGPDGHGRWGNYFAHVLAGLPQRFTAREAIRLWRSRF